MAVDGPARSEWSYGGPLVVLAGIPGRILALAAAAEGLADGGD